MFVPKINSRSAERLHNVVYDSQIMASIILSCACKRTECNFFCDSFVGVSGGIIIATLMNTIMKLSAWVSSTVYQESSSFGRCTAHADTPYVCHETPSLISGSCARTKQ